MKNNKIISMCLTIAFLIASYNKGNSINQTKNKNSTGGGIKVLLSKIINNTQGDKNFGKLITEFHYDGSKLISAVKHLYPIVDSCIFNYNKTGSLVSVDNYYYKTLVSSTFVTCKNGKITEINDGRIDVNFLYSGYSLTQIQLNGPGGQLTTTCTYNTNSNLEKANMKLVAANTGGVANLSDNYSNFDDKNYVLNALPFREYFCQYKYFPYDTPFYNSNNFGQDLNIDETLSQKNAYNFSYTYNSYNFPTSITITKGGVISASFLFDYIIYQ